MELERQKILIDIDDTFLKSSEEIIRQINIKNGTSKTIDDLTDYKYRSIDNDITPEQVNQMYSSNEFFSNVAFNDGAIEFLIKYSKIFDIIFVSYGTEENLLRKAIMLDELVLKHNLTRVCFASFEIGKANKSEILLDNVYLAIDNHCEHLKELNAPKKILLKNFKEVDWNKTPINDEITYVVNSFSDIDQMIQFDLQLKDMGILLDNK
jgi:5'(3')-deoxyribonucleotidase